MSTADNETTAEKSEFDQRDLRRALSSFATGVTIVTTVDDDAKPVGMTASSFNSVSMDPPLILWSVTKSALSAPAFKEAKHFAVHVLGSDQVELSNRFASRGEDKFAGVDYIFNTQNIPVFSDSLSCFECSTWAVYEGGDHWIIVGKVEALSTNSGEGLVFSSGSYATASALNSGVSQQQQSSEPAVDAIDNKLFYNLSRAYRQMSNQFHTAVLDDNLTIAEWRILASLHGGMTRKLSDLSARTFIPPVGLIDKVRVMQKAGLCEITENKGEQEVVGTPAGHDRVDGLLALGAAQEKAALEGAGPDERVHLIALLKRVIDNTNQT